MKAISLESLGAITIGVALSVFFVYFLGWIDAGRAADRLFGILLLGTAIVINGALLGRNKLVY